MNTQDWTYERPIDAAGDISDETRDASSSEFVRGWIAATNHGRYEAGEQWAGFSRSLSDHERELVESAGFASGFEMGTAWNTMYP
jgi:hypothetical protein